MTLYLSQKKLLFLLLGGLLLGVCFGAVYDLLRLLRMKEPRRAVLKGCYAAILHLSDALFFACFGVADAILFFVYHNGRVRISVFVMNLLGFLLYRVTVSRMIFQRLRRVRDGVCTVIIKWVRAVFRAIVKKRKDYEKEDVLPDHCVDDRDCGTGNGDLDTDRSA
ncbi:MAG: spore cortex biosynthesis protein YabQ [Clostridia bacterium]|nr:spore cortex biosynthesis protein YabQ [Clostridia bacterium]